MNPSFQLYQLQKIDLQLDKIASRLAVINDILSNDAQVKKAGLDAQNARLNVQAAQKRLHDCEIAVKDKRIKIEQSEASLYGGSVRNPKELLDLQSEIVSLKKHLATLEDAQLEAMVNLEEAELSSTQQEHVMNEAQASAISRNAALNGEQQQLLHDKERLQVERTATASQLQSDGLAIYDRLRSQKKGVVVATVDENACSACGSEINPADRQAARSPSKIVFCPFCGRILYSG